MPAVTKYLQRKRQQFARNIARESRHDKFVEEKNRKVTSGETKSHQMLEYRRRCLRALRAKRWKKTGPRSSQQPSSQENLELRSARSQTLPELNENYIVNLKLLGEGLRQCQKCHAGPLSLDDICKTPMRIGLGVVLHVKCKDCKEENKIKPYHSHRTGRRGPKTVKLNSRAALAMIHTGQGHSHLKADLSILGVGAMTSATFKAREREVGSAIESVCQESCARYRAKEKAESNMVDSNGDALISVAYDGAWQKRGKARDSITGFGTVIGESTGKVLDYGVRSTRCRKCEIAGKSNAVSHNCRKNHSGSSKSMEPEIAVACFNNATNHGLKYSSYTGDEDATTESHVKCRVNYETAKKTDKNHATRTLGSRLYSAQKTVKGLTSVIINYFLKLFAYCISTKQGESAKIKQGLNSLVCHAFGDHCKCA